MVVDLGGRGVVWEDRWLIEAGPVEELPALNLLLLWWCHFHLQASRLHLKACWLELTCLNVIDKPFKTIFIESDQTIKL